jgi:hypothetical protein
MALCQIQESQEEGRITPIWAPAALLVVPCQWVMVFRRSCAPGRRQENDGDALKKRREKTVKCGNGAPHVGSDTAL